MKKTLSILLALLCFASCHENGLSPDSQYDDNVIDLSELGTANCYIVPARGSYQFTPAKGNSGESVGEIASAEVLWETYGTHVVPKVGDLVKNVKYENGVITFKTPSSYKEGNAVISAKDADGTILWSWHIWLTDQPEGQVYYNNAGTVMDRNLGATSATPGDVGALGLLYQWGRKDPFLGSSSISSNITARSTLAWPSAVSSDSNNGTIEYVTANPTTFITSRDGGNSDWYYTGSYTTDNTRWTESSGPKSIYDPCPAGWRVPDGSENGVWSRATGTSSHLYPTFDDTRRGFDFSGLFGADKNIWYPSSGYLHINSGHVSYVDNGAFYWSASPGRPDVAWWASCLYFYYPTSLISPAHNQQRAYGCAVRCIQE